jgi:hypothetical protein
LNKIVRKVTQPKLQWIEAAWKFDWTMRWTVLVLTHGSSLAEPYATDLKQLMGLYRKGFVYLGVNTMNFRLSTTPKLLKKDQAPGKGDAPIVIFAHSEPDGKGQYSLGAAVQLTGNLTSEGDTGAVIAKALTRYAKYQKSGLATGLTAAPALIDKVRHPRQRDVSSA